MCFTSSYISYTLHANYASKRNQANSLFNHVFSESDSGHPLKDSWHIHVYIVIKSNGISIERYKPKSNQDGKKSRKLMPCSHECVLNF